MKTLLQNPNALRALPQGIGPVLGVLIEFPYGTHTSMFLVSPLRHIFRCALHSQIAEWGCATATPRGVFIVMVVRDVETSVAKIRGILEMLRYGSIAHIGRLFPEPQGWTCLYGQADQVRDFGSLAVDSQSEIEAWQKLLTAHIRAFADK